MTYVDGFVLVIPKKNTKAYVKMATEASKVWTKFGALEYFECKGDDMKPKWVTLTFPKAYKAKASEAVWFSFIVYRNKAHRNSVNKKVMAYFDKKYAGKKQEMPFDMKRFSYAGFKTMVQK